MHRLILTVVEIGGVLIDIPLIRRVNLSEVASCTRGNFDRFKHLLGLIDALLGPQASGEIASLFTWLQKILNDGSILHCSTALEEENFERVRDFQELSEIVLGRLGD